MKELQVLRKALEIRAYIQMTKIDVTTIFIILFFLPSTPSRRQQGVNSVFLFIYAADKDHKYFLGF